MAAMTTIVPSFDEILKNAIETFQKTFHSMPNIAGCAPGRVNLIGEHIDYNDGYVLPMVRSEMSYDILMNGEWSLWLVSHAHTHIHRHTYTHANTRRLKAPRHHLIRTLCACVLIRSSDFHSNRMNAMAEATIRQHNRNIPLANMNYFNGTHYLRIMYFYSLVPRFLPRPPIPISPTFPANG